MELICQEMGLQIDLDTLALGISQNTNTARYLFQLFGIISLRMTVGKDLEIIRHFAIDEVCTVLPMEQLNPFRQLVIMIYKVLNKHHRKNRRPIINFNLPEFSQLIRTLKTNENQQKLLQMSYGDVNFLKEILRNYVIQLSIQSSRPFLELLLDFANLFCNEVKQSMVQNCIFLRLLQNERKRQKEERQPPSEKRQRISLEEPSSYDCQCSGCARRFQLPEICYSVLDNEALCLNCALHSSSMEFFPLDLISFAKLE
jgi:hypothetical protein